MIDIPPDQNAILLVEVKWGSQGLSRIYIDNVAKTNWSGTSYRRIHFLPFTRDGRGYVQITPFNNLWNLMTTRSSGLPFFPLDFSFFFLIVL